MFNFVNIKLQHTSLQTLTMKIFKLCVKYTIAFNLMPNWNKFHEYLSTGLDFRNPTDELDAVKLDITVEGKLKLELKKVN